MGLAGGNALYLAMETRDEWSSRLDVYGYVVLVHVDDWRIDAFSINKVERVETFIRVV